MAGGESRWRGIVVLGGMLGLAVSLGVLGLTLRDLGTAANLAQLVSVVLAVPPLAVGLVLWWRRSAGPVAATAAHVDEAKEVLAGLVAEQWTAEAALRSVEDPHPIPVRWRLTERDEVMDHPENVASVPLTFTGSSDQIADLAERFRALDRRRLVILGGPGTGKTTLAVQLALRLLASRRRDEPVPVLVSVAGWDPQAQPRLRDWLAVRLAQDYPALRATALGDDCPRVLAARGHLLPVLDGLDELPGPARARVVVALNRSLGGADGLILTSRTGEFADAVEAASDVLTSAVVIEPRPLPAAIAADYLHRSLPRRPGPVWEQILTALRAPAPSSAATAALVEAVSTPLGVWLLRSVYIGPGTDPAPLLDSGRFPTAETLRAHLFDRLIEALIVSRPPSDDPAEPFRPRRTWDPARVRRWLGHLAYHLNHLPTADGQTGTRDFAWWHLARHTLHPRTLWLTARLVGGLSAWLRGGFAAPPWSEEGPGFADVHIAGRIPVLIRIVTVNVLGRRAAVSGLVTGAATGLVTALMDGVRAGLVTGLMVGFGIGFVTGLMDGLIEWAETPTPRIGRAARSPAGGRTGN